MESIEQGPALWVPLLFLLTAPLFGIAAGLVVAWHGADAMASRWSAEAVAVTHLLTTGFMLQAIFGALLQVIPVAAGGNVWRPQYLAALVYPVVSVGAVSLGASFVLGQPDMLWPAATLLAVGSGVFALPVGIALLRSSAASATVDALRASMVSFVVTIVLGVALALTMSGSLRLVFIETANLHAAWGLGGWALLLLAGVSMYVVPMFQLTPLYPAWLGRVLAPGLLAALLVMSIGLLTGQSSGWRAAACAAGIVLTTIFAATTLRLQAHRRRMRIDPTFHFFRGAMLSLLAAACLLALIWTSVGAQPALPVLLGVLLLVGVFVSAINGMLYKIVPFLCSMQLQRTGKLPHRKSSASHLISERAMQGQRWLHLAALAALLGAAWRPDLAGPAGIAFAASCTWLEGNLLIAVRRYRALIDPTRAAAAAGGS